jgi:hypothetical protein
MAAHSYWRLWFASKNGSNFNYQALWSLDFQDGAGASLCTGGTPFASSAYGGNVAANVFGGSPSGWISNNELPCSIGYHFATPVSPAKIALAPWNGGNYPVLAVAQSSDDGTTWTDEYLISQPTAWINQHVYTMNVPTGDTTAQYWLMRSTLMQNGVAANTAVVAEMRFLDNNGNPFAGFTDMRGAFNSNSGDYSWALAWDGNVATTAYGGTTGNVFSQTMYPSPVSVRGLSIQAGTDGFYLPTTPAAGDIYSSADGMIWGKVWSFSDTNATGLPIAVGHVVSYNAPPLLTGTLYRRAMLLS